MILIRRRSLLPIPTAASHIKFKFFKPKVNTRCSSSILVQYQYSSRMNGRPAWYVVISFSSRSASVYKFMLIGIAQLVLIIILKFRVTRVQLVLG